MRAIGNSGNCVGGLFGDPDAISLHSAPLASAIFSATRISRELKMGEEATVVVPAHASYFLMLYLRDTAHCDVEADGSQSVTRQYCRGSICLIDILNGAQISLKASLKAVTFVIPHVLVDEIAALSVPGASVELKRVRGSSDPVIASLGTALQPLFDRKEKSDHVLLQHIAMAICAHLIHHYSLSPFFDGSGEDSASVH